MLITVMMTGAEDACKESSRSGEVSSLHASGRISEATTTHFRRRALQTPHRSLQPAISTSACVFATSSMATDIIIMRAVCDHRPITCFHWFP